MTEEAAALAREAKSLQQALKESLKSKDPWDRETDFTRKQLRRSCLRLLLLHPYAPESKEAETMLWIQTSYAFISVYKQRIATLDRLVYGNSRQQQQQQQPQEGQPARQGQQQPRQNGGHGVVEYRKLLQRFRQFLADEEKFWIQLILRIRRLFQLDDVQPILAQLEILPVDDAPSEDGPPKRNHFQFPPDADLAAASPSLTPTSREQRESRLAILSKALVCLGDIERYKEQYNESGGRPRAGHEDGPPAVMPNNQKGRGRKGGSAAQNILPVLARMRDYRKAQQCYQQARLLLPQDGNPAHQLAIIASYQKDTFSSLVHYYRALCVRSPYDTAADNLGTVLAKALESWKSRGAKKEKEREKEQARGETSLAPRLRVEAFKERLIVLHALWCIPPEEAHAIAPNLAQKVAEDFKSLVSDRVLPSDIISNVIVLAQGALWKHRMFRNTSSNGHRRNMHAGAATAIESAIVGHLLAVHRVLLEVGIVQIAEAPTEDTAEHDLAQRITAEFRRTLPALRTGSKWLRANLRYLSQAWQQLIASEEGEGPPAKPKSRDRRRGSDRRSSGGSGTAVAPGLREFWRTYAHFSTVLRRAFPQDRLPKSTTTLEEDVEMAGFQPLKRFVLSEVVSVVGAAKDAPKEGSNNGAAHSGFRMVQPEQVHPNEEQLMRIADLLSDAVSLARDDICPLQVSGGRFSVQEPPRRAEPRSTQPRQQPRPEPRHPRPQESPQRSIPERLSPQAPMRPTYDVCAMAQQEEDGMTDVTRTEDDPVGDAFREALGAPSDAGDEDDEQILWPRAQPAPPPLPHDPAIITAMPANAGATVPSPPRAIDPSPALPTSGPRSPLSLSPIAPPGRSAEATPALSLGTPQKPATTAQDILANLQRGPPKADVTRSLHARQASAPAFHALFPNSLGGGPSIWSSDESDGLVFQGAAGALSGSHYQSYQLSNGLPQNQLQHNHVRHASSSLYPVQPSLSVEQAPLAPPRPLAGLTNAGLSHQRVQSLSMNNNTQFLSSIPGPHLFSSSQSQPPVPEGFGSYPALSEQSTVPYSTGVPGAYADPVYSRKTDTGFARRDAPGYPDRSVPYHLDPRTNDGHAGFSLSTMAQLWNNTG